MVDIGKLFFELNILKHVGFVDSKVVLANSLHCLILLLKNKTKQNKTKQK